MNKTLKKIIIIATVSVVVYFGLNALFSYLDWNLARQYDYLNHDFEGVIGGRPHDVGLIPSEMVSVINVFITLISLVLSIIVVFIKKARHWLYYLIPLIILSWLFTNRFKDSLYHMQAWDNVYYKVCMDDPLDYNSITEGAIYSRWGVKLQDVEGHIKEYRSNNGTNTYLVDTFSKNDWDDSRCVARVYDKRAKFVMELIAKNYPDLNEKVQKTLNCYLVE